MRRFLLPLLPLVAVACSAATSDAGSATESVTGGSICQTLDYGGPSEADYYRHFATDADAGEYIKALIAQGQLAGNAGPNAEFKEVSTDPRWVGLAKEIFTGFQKTFPRETAGMTAPPPVIIVKSDIPNAYALGPGFAENPQAPKDRSPWLFIVHTKISEGTFTDDELRGLFAHEMGHLILKTFLPDIQKRVRAIYKIEGSRNSIIGATQHNDPAIEAHVNEILARQQRIGSIQFLGLPMAAPGAYMKILNNMIASAPASDACTALKTDQKTLQDLQVLLLPNNASGNLVPSVPTAAQQAELDRLSALVTTEIKTCIAPVEDKAALSDLSQMLGVAPLPAEQNIDATMASAPIGERILAAEAEVRAELIALRNDPAFPIDQLRVFDYEEDADDASVRVLTTLGHDATGVGQMVLDLSPDTTLKSKCMASVAAGETIPYGQFFDTHEPSCWRYYHTTQFSKALSSCGPTE
jgi:hypothetical protein